jgi:hypothetical protein
MWLLPQGEFYPKQQSKSNNIKEAEAINYSIDNNRRFEK